MEIDASDLADLSLWSCKVCAQCLSKRLLWTFCMLDRPKIASRVPLIFSSKLIVRRITCLNFILLSCIWQSTLSCRNRTCCQRKGSGAFKIFAQRTYRKILLGGFLKGGDIKNHFGLIMHLKLHNLKQSYGVLQFSYVSLADISLFTQIMPPSSGKY